MLKAFSTRLLQHLLAQNGWANAMLQPFATKSIQLNVVFGFGFTVTVIAFEGKLLHVSAVVG